MKIIKCNRCGHEWITKSKLRMVTCASCLYKVEMKNEVEENGTANNNRDKYIS